MSGGACSAKAKSRRSALELESVFTVCWACGVVVFIFVIGGVDLVPSLRIRESSKPSVSPCFCGVIPESGNSNALGAVGSKVASLPPNSSNRFIISSDVYFLPLLPSSRLALSISAKRNQEAGAWCLRLIQGGLGFIGFMMIDRAHS